MKKTIYICLMTLFFSLSAFASFDEYGGLSGNFGSPVTNTGAMTAGGNFWSTNVSAMVANNGVVTNNFDYYSPRYYVGTGGNTQQKDNTNWQTAPSIIDYEQRAGDVINLYWLHTTLDPASPLVLDTSGNAQFGFIITNGGSIMQPSNNYAGYTPEQINNTIMGIGNYDPNPPTKPYFAYNDYNSSNNTNTVRVFEATPNGPVLVSTKVIVTYNAIPRVGVLGFTAQPPPDFYAAAQLSSKTSLTLAETATYIEKYIDRVFPDIAGAGGRVAQIESLIPKLVNGLPDQQKWQARDLLIQYTTAHNKYPNMTEAQFNNWFMGKSEGIDGDYDATYWENPNLTFPKQSLPTYANFSANFPYNTDSRYDSPQKMYNSIGGAVATLYSGPNTNTCAVRLSKALNYSGVIIPNLPGKTFQGADGKYYFKAAYEINNWMRQTFGTNPASTTNPKTPYNPNHVQYSQTDAGEHGINLPGLLLGKQGIYSIYSSNFQWATGHADLLKSDATCGNQCHFYDAPIYRLDVWILN